MKWEHCYASLADQSLSLPRFAHSAVATTDTNGSCQVVIYGGVGCASGETAQTALGDVAVLQVDSGTWSAPDILPGSSPGPRAFHSAVALECSCMLLFGGHILSFDAEHNRKKRNFFNDMWQLDLVEWQWRQVPADPSSSSPARRDMSALLQLQDGQLLLFGGRSESQRALQDTWLYDIPSNTWQQLKPVGALPPARKMHTMVKVGGQVVLFGGESDNGPLDDVWLLGGWAQGEVLRWTQLRLRSAPASRFGHAMAAVAVSSGAAAGQPAPSATSSRRSSQAGSSESTQGEAQADEAVSPFIAAAAGTNTPAPAAAFAAEGTSEGSSAAAAAPSSAAGPADGGSSSSSGGQGQQQQLQQQHVVVFGGCLDLSGILSLNKNYVQSRETWLLQLDTLTWLQMAQPPAAAEAPPLPWPCERMCHSLTALPDGRLLVFGGRNKEGICRDMWLLDMSSPDERLELDSGAPQPAGALSLPPASPRPSTAGSGSSATAVKPSPSRPGSQSLLQSLLGPVRARVPSQGLLRGGSNAAQQAPTSSTLPGSTPPTSQAASPKHGQQPPSQQLQQQQQQQEDGVLQPLGLAPGDDATAKPVSVGGTAGQASGAAGFGSGAGAGGGDVAAAAATAAAPGSSSGQQPLASLMDVSSGEFAKLLRNPAAYGVGAIGKLSSSVTSTVSSLLVGKDGQPGTMLPRLPEAFMRVAPSWAPVGPFGTRGSTGSGQPQQQSQGVDMPALVPLRQQLGLQGSLGAVAAAGQTAQALRAPAHVLQELAVLGQQLLGDGGTTAAPQGGASAAAASTSSSIPADVLVAAARQHLMSAETAQLHVRHVVLLLADYQQLAASYYAHMMLSKLSDGFSAAAAAAGASQAIGDAGQCGSAFLQRQPTDLLLHQVGQLQQQYRHLLLQSAA